ncbi:MAG: hypothetical protein EXQ82_06180 [Pseudolabrys sp.]|nr:hypothetical protein [Pseudolabrys sp.]
MRLTGIERTEYINHLHGLELSLATAAGRSAAAASIELTGQRRYAPNLLPTSPRVRPGAVDGTYKVEGLRFHMVGEWRLVFAIEFAQIRDHARR